MAVRTTRATARSAGAALVVTVLLSVLAPAAHAAGGAYTVVSGAGVNPLHAVGNADPASYVAADFDGDGDLDVAARHEVGDTTVDYFRNEGGTFTALTGSANPFASISFAASSNNFRNTRMLVADLDGDGDVDVWHDATTGAVFYRNDGASFSAHTGGEDPLAALDAYDADSYVLIDFDGDGDLDVAAREPSGDASIQAFRNEHDGTFSALAGAANPFAGITFAATAGNFTNNRVLVLDTDGDGDTDLWNHGVGLNVHYRNDGATFSAQTGANDPLDALGAFDSASYVVVDADRDGDRDVVVREPVLDDTVVMLRNDGGSFAVPSGAANPFDGISFGAPLFELMNVLVGDFDSDGDADVYNQSVNELYVQGGTAPQLGATSPVNGTTGVPRTSALALTFDEPVTLGSGVVSIHDATTGEIRDQLDVVADAARVTGAGTPTVTIAPTTPLPIGASVYVLVAPGAFIAASDGDAFAGITHPQVWAFTVSGNVAPTIVALDGDAAAFTEGGGPVRLDQGTAATVSDATSPDFDGGSITVHITANAAPAEDVVAIATTGSVALSAGATAGSVVSVAGVAIGTITADGSGGDLSVVLGPNATPARVE
ncbi:MAG TPA: FG-GAP-like repeat-containing protein, partial [Acidimicrobiales bacterium]|nr:FG-GAP-like repeat-containing protein [Acidimicrobiales bacterium]